MYVKTIWVDQVKDEVGTVIIAGTPFNAKRMNNIEDGIYALYQDGATTDSMIGERTIQNPVDTSVNITGTITGLLSSLSKFIATIFESLSNHLGNISNPHKTTKTQVGLGNVLNITQASQTDFNTHKSDSNIHITSAERTAWNGKQAALGFTPENVGNKNAANGYAGLDENGRVADCKNLLGVPAEKYSQIEQSNLYGVGTWSSATLSVAINSNIASLVAGMNVYIKLPSSDSPANPKLNVNSLGLKTILKPDGTQPKAKELKGIISVVYDGTNFYLTGKGGDDYDNIKLVIEHIVHTTPRTFLGYNEENKLAIVFNKASNELLGFKYGTNEVVTISEYYALCCATMTNEYIYYGYGVGSDIIGWYSYKFSTGKSTKIASASTSYVSSSYTMKCISNPSGDSALIIHPNSKYATFFKSGSRKSYDFSTYFPTGNISSFKGCINNISGYTYIVVSDTIYCFDISLTSATLLWSVKLDTITSSTTSSADTVNVFADVSSKTIYISEGNVTYGIYYADGSVIVQYATAAHKMLKFDDEKVFAKSGALVYVTDLEQSIEFDGIGDYDSFEFIGYGENNKYDVAINFTIDPLGTDYDSRSVTALARLTGYKYKDDE